MGQDKAAIQAASNKEKKIAKQKAVKEAHKEFLKQINGKKIMPRSKKKERKHIKKV